MASDARPSGGAGVSDAFFIEISKLGVVAGEGFTIPQAETKYALSEQMLILKTERLRATGPTITDEEYRRGALELAAEQRLVRAELVFMLGGEVEDEELEAEQSTELQEGRLANRGQSDLRTATRAMSSAQKMLTAADTVQALVAERAAVRALERAFARDRYILRAPPNRSRIDAARRLTGTLAGASDWIRIVSNPAPSRRSLLVADLLHGLGDLVILQEGDDSTARLQVLAEETLRIDPESTSLRSASVELQRLAAGWSGSDARARGQRLDAISAMIVDEARRGMADAPVRASTSHLRFAARSATD